MHRLLLAMLLCAAVLPSGEARAFWRRSQVSMCADATTEAERVRLRCWELDGYMDHGWPALGLGGAYAVPGGAAPPPRLPAQPLGRGVTRRLG
ncbi:hypothetical protein [Bosea sp. (in: a-proteobacteria)]|uniref:hypothetical protein n=1 Tax=Bosea sp. (in: a-proteobacteria) TaxID=1871050 RepID=UPI003B3A6F23